MPGGGGDHSSRRAIVAARERERQVVQLVIRGLTWGEIARQLGMGDESTARKAFNRAIKRFPPADVELLRKLQSERLRELRLHLFAELAGREKEVPDPANPGSMKRITVRPEVSEVSMLVGRLLDVEKREADLYGIDAPKRSEVLAAVTGQAVSDEELDIWLARLTQSETETFMMLLAKAQGRWVEPPAIEEGSVETTATAVQTNGAGS
jgi:hypothetical protein